MLQGLLLIAVAAVSWGTTGSVATILVTRAGAHPVLIGAARAWLATVLLVLAARVAHGSVAVAREDRWRCVGLGACMALYQAAYFTAVTLTGIVIAALIAICSAPLLIAGLAALVLHERPSARVLTALGVGVVGAALLLAGPTPIGSPRSASGALLALVAGAAYAGYVVLAKAALRRTAPLAVAGTSFGVAALLLTLPVAMLEAPARQVVLGWPGLLYLGVVTTAGAYAAYTLGLARVPASVAGVAALLEPLTATFLGVVVFGERLGAPGAAGAVMIFGALGLLVPRRGAPLTPRGSAARPRG